MKRIVIGSLLLILTATVILVLWLYGRSSKLPLVDYVPLINNSHKSVESVIVTSPLAGATISSPVTIKGQARGWWFFEASFPIKIIDANGQLLGIVPAQAQTDWMTTDFVPFEVSVEFSQPSTSSGFIVLLKDNPSGLPENDAEVRVPVQFKLALGNSENIQRTIKLYYYNPSRDQDAQGNIQCSQQGLVEVERQIPISQSPIKDTLELFLNSPLSDDDKALGLTSEFPLSGVSLNSLSLHNGNLTVQLLDAENKIAGGSCRVSILKEQLEAVVKQFPEVVSVIFEPAELFQP